MNYLWCLLGNEIQCSWKKTHPWKENVTELSQSKGARKVVSLQKKAYFLQESWEVYFRCHLLRPLRWTLLHKWQLWFQWDFIKAEVATKCFLEHQATAPYTMSAISDFLFFSLSKKDQRKKEKSFKSWYCHPDLHPTTPLCTEATPELISSYYELSRNWD